MTPEHLAMLSGWTVSTAEDGTEVRFVLHRNNRRREVTVRDGVLHIVDLHYISRETDLRVYRTWHTFAAIVQAWPNPFTEELQTSSAHSAVGLCCAVTGGTLWVSTYTLRKHMGEAHPSLPTSPEGYYDVLNRLCGRELRSFSA